MSLSKYRSSKRGKIDSWLFLAVLALGVFGLVMISSASVVLSFKNFDNNYYYIWHQAVTFLLGLVAMAVFAIIDYRVWQKTAPYLLGIALIFLFLTHVPGIGLEVKGASRWIALGPLVFQPSELIKLFAIFYFASWLSAKKEDLGSLQKGFVPFVILTGGIGLLIFLQPDAGTALVTLGTLVTMYFIAGAPYIHFIYGSLLGIFLVVPMILSKPYRLERVMVLFNSNADKLGSGYHINQALLAIGAGGLFGLGFGESKQKYLYLPEPHTDSIFAIIIEELGFLRALFVIGIMLFIIMRGLAIAKYAPDDFSKLVATGITMLIAIQTFINISAMLGLIPLTGVTLPFVSYGGSSLIVMLAAVGVLLNISKSSTRKA